MEDLTQKITPFLWYDDRAEDAMNYYVSIFRNSRIVSISRYREGPMKGKVMTGIFELNGQQFMAIDGGPHFSFTEAVSLFVKCQTQEEVDYYGEKLSDGGDENAQRCGWLKDRFGLSWQIIPVALPALLNGSDPAASKRAMDAMMQMKKIEIRALEQAYNHL